MGQHFHLQYWAESVYLGGYITDGVGWYENNDLCNFSTGHTSAVRFMCLKSYQHHSLQGDLKLKTLRRTRLENKDYVIVNFMYQFC